MRICLNRFGKVRICPIYLHKLVQIKKPCPNAGKMLPEYGITKPNCCQNVSQLSNDLAQLLAKVENFVWKIKQFLKKRFLLRSKQFSTLKGNKLSHCLNDGTLPKSIHNLAFIDNNYFILHLKISKT